MRTSYSVKGAPQAWITIQRWGHLIRQRSTTSRNNNTAMRTFIFWSYSYPHGGRARFSNPGVQLQMRTSIFQCETLYSLGNIHNLDQLITTNQNGVRYTRFTTKERHKSTQDLRISLNQSKYWHQTTVLEKKLKFPNHVTCSSNQTEALGMLL